MKELVDLPFSGFTEKISKLRIYVDSIEPRSKRS
jgi:hypothetical protein